MQDNMPQLLFRMFVGEGEMLRIPPYEVMLGTHPLKPHRCFLCFGTVEMECADKPWLLVWYRNCFEPTVDPPTKNGAKGPGESLPYLTQHLRIISVNLSYLV